MMTRKNTAWRLLTVAVLFAAGAGAPEIARAQVVDPGATRVQMSDVTGPNVTSLLLFETGTVKTFSCPVAWGVRTTSDRLAAELRAGRIVAGGTNGNRVLLAPAAQQRVLEILVNGPDADNAADAVIAALAPDMRDQQDARGSARTLVRNLRGLLKHAGTMNPRSPGHQTATNLAAAVYRFNDYLDESSPAFLVAPPAEFTIIENVLSTLIVAALDNDGREVDAASKRGEYGLPCAPEPVVAQAPPRPTAPPPPTFVPPPPPIERAVVLCVLEADAFHYLPAIMLPATGEIFAVQNGRRVPFASAHPDQGYAGDAAWVKSGEAIAVGKAKYMPYGARQVVRPAEELEKLGEYRGTALFARKDAGKEPKVILVPVAQGCVVQPYNLLVDIRKER
jgi:hypothetical protein